MKPVIAVQTIAKACEMQVVAQRVIGASARCAVSAPVLAAARDYSGEWSALMAGTVAANDEQRPSA